MEINNREIASIIWFLLFIFGVIFFSKNNEDIRTSLGYVVKDFFQRTIITTTIVFTVYILFIIYICYLINAWDISLVKETILWSFVAFSNIFKITEKGNFKDKIKSIALRCFTLSFIIEYIANMASFGLIAELIITPLVTIIALMSVVAESDEKHMIIRKPLNYLLIAWGIFILIYSAYTVLNNQDLNLATESKKFILPFVLTALFTPFPYFFFLYCQYERLYTPIAYNIKSKKEAIKIVYRVFRAFGFNLFALEVWQDNIHPYHLRSVADVESKLELKE